MEEFFMGLLEIIRSILDMALMGSGGSKVPVEAETLLWLKISTQVLLLVAAVFTAYFAGKRVLKTKIQEILIDPDAFWNKKASRKQIRSYRRNLEKSKPVIAVVNYKGGVGKSMISANLAAYFDKIGLRVLLLDYDYQGSLTDIVPYEDRNKMTFSAQYVLEGKDGYQEPEKLGKSFQRTDIYPAEMGLSKVDSKLIFDWLIGAEKKDIRFHTHEYLSRPDVQEKYDIIIIDTPPRLSAATANALCACTHIIVPAILDTVTSRTVIRSLKMFRDFRESLGLGFSFLGIVPSKVRESTGYTDREEAALEYLEVEIRSHFGNMVIPETKQLETVEVLREQPIMHKVGLLHIDGDDLAFFKPNPSPGEAIITQMFTNLGSNIVKKLGIA